MLCVILSIVRLWCDVILSILRLSILCIGIIFMFFYAQGMMFNSISQYSCFCLILLNLLEIILLTSVYLHSKGKLKLCTLVGGAISILYHVVFLWEIIPLISVYLHSRGKLNYAHF